MKPMGKYFATFKFKRLRLWLAPNMYGFPRITDENHSSIGLVTINTNEMLIKYKIICGFVIIIIVQKLMVCMLAIEN